MRELDNGSRWPLRYEPSNPSTIEEVQIELLAFYQFLQKRYLREIFIPPPEGWDIAITGKTDAVVTFLKHIPYSEGQVYAGCQCVDYRGKTDISDVEHEALRDERRITLFNASGEYGDGDYLIFSEPNKTVELVDIDHEPPYGSVYHFLYQWLDVVRYRHEHFYWCPINTREVVYVEYQRRDAVKRVFQRHGWPDKYDKLACLREVRWVLDKIEYGDVDADIDPRERDNPGRKTMAAPQADVDDEPSLQQNSTTRAAVTGLLNLAELNEYMESWQGLDLGDGDRSSAGTTYPDSCFRTASHDTFYYHQ